MAVPTVFLSAATIDLKEWRDVLHGAFSRAGFRVLTQEQSLQSPLGDVKRLLTETIADEVGDRRANAAALGNLGLAHYALSDASKAIEYNGQALLVCRETGDRRAQGTILSNLGLAHAALGDARNAIKYHEQALIVTREIGDRRGESHALWNSALAHDSLGNCPEAIARAAAALEIYEAIESPRAAMVRTALAKWRAT